LDDSNCTIQGGVQNKFWNVDMNIRELTQNDYSDWCRLWTGYLEFYETSVPEEVCQTTFQRLISDEHPNQMAFAAENDGILVGLVHYIRHPHNWKIGCQTKPNTSQSTTVTQIYEAQIWNHSMRAALRFCL
jgi:hypothetical protein